MQSHFNILFKISSGSLCVSLLSTHKCATFFSLPSIFSLQITYPSPSAIFSISFLFDPYNFSCSTCITSASSSDFNSTYNSSCPVSLSVFTSTSWLSSVCSAAYVVTFPLVTIIVPTSSIAPNCFTILLFITSSWFILFFETILSSDQTTFM